MQTRAEILTLDTIRDALTPALEASDAQRAIVFGSYARGDADEYSDLDLMIVAETDKRFLQRHEDYIRIWDVMDLWRKDIDMLIYTPDDISGMIERDNPFISRAVADGVVIYERERKHRKGMAASGDD